MSSQRALKCRGAHCFTRGKAAEVGGKRCLGTWPRLRRDCAASKPSKSSEEVPTSKGNGEEPEKGARSLGGAFTVIPGALSPVLSQFPCEQLLFSAGLGKSSAFIHSV